MEVILLGLEHETAYEEFIAANNTNLLYHSLKFRNFLIDLLNCEHHYLMACSEGRIFGVLPLLKTDGVYGTVYNSLPFYGSNGGIVTENEESFDSLVDYYNTLIENKEVASSTVITNPLNELDHSILKHNLTDKRIGQFTELNFNQDTDPETELMAKIESSTRRNVRKARKEGVEVRIENGMIDFLREVHYNNMAAIKGRPKQERFFELIEKHFVPGEDYNLYVAFHQGEPVAALLLFYYNQTVEYYVPAIIERFRTIQPLALIVFTAMLEAFQAGYRLWNWGGTWLTQDGVYRFKKKWGTLDKEYTYYTCLNNDDIYESDAATLLSEYPNFFVLPFSKLKESQ